MTFTFLGTSAGTPTKSRNVSALGVNFDKNSKWYLFDCGEGTQHQLLRSDLSIGKLDKIFITHLHGDHCFGLAGLIASKSMNEIKTPLLIVTHISPQYRFNPSKTKESITLLAKEIKDNFSGEFFIANDLDKFYLDKYKKLLVKGVKS